MTSSNERHTELGTGRDRRTSPRIEVLGHVHGHIVSLDARMTALDLGAGGFSMETTFPVDANSEHDFRLVGPTGASFQLRARVAHCRHYTSPDGTPRYVSGLQFTDPAQPADDIIDQLLEVLSFDVV